MSMGFPPSGSGQLIDPSTLPAATKKEIERRIFGALPDSTVDYIKKYRDRLAVTFDVLALTEDGGAYYESDSEDDFHPKQITPVNLNTTAVRAPSPPTRPIIDLNWYDFNILFNSRRLDETKGFNGEGDKRYMRPTTRSNTIEQYIAMICGHANTIRRAALPEDERLDENGEEILSCKWLPGTQFEAIRSEFSRPTSNRATVLFNIRNALESIDVTRENFVTLDYLFMPVLRDGHYVLYGLAPKQRKLFVVNSFPDDRFHRDPEYNRDTMLAILRYLVPREDRDVWDMDVDIVRRSDDATDTRAVFQRDKYNCGVYVCTNALCLAFGYDMLCYKPRELDQFRKQRMIAEMKNGGFTGIYNYDIFELPQTPSLNPATAMRYKVLLAAHKRRGGERLPDGLNDTPLGSQESSPNSIVSNVSSQSNSDTAPSYSDDDEARGLDNIDIVAANLPIKKSKKTVPIPIFPTASQCLYIDNHFDTPRPESIARPVDPQFDARYGFLYPFYHVDFDEAIKCSREEMIEACKNFPIANWERWCDFPKDFFLDWMMTEMGATMARIHKDPVLPMPGLGDGYEIWLKWKAEGKRNVQAKEAAALETANQAEKDKEATKSTEIDETPASKTSPGEAKQTETTLPLKKSPRAAKSKDKKKTTTPTRKSPRLASAKIKLVENAEEEVVTQSVTVMSALRGRPRKRQRISSEPEEEKDDSEEE